MNRIRVGLVAAFMLSTIVGMISLPSQAQTVTGFSDVPSSHPFSTAIRWLSSEGITRGCNPPSNTRFCPDARVTRGQMAVFLSRAFGYSDRGTVDFVDDDGHLFEPYIEMLATAGVTRGCNPPANDRFCPNDYVTRGQMAAFLHRAFGYPTPTTTTTQPPTFCEAQTAVPETECEALLAFHDSTNGDSWTDNTGWTEDPDVCSWYGIGCSGGHVVELDIAENNLSGPIPPTIEDLGALEALYLASNSLTGSIPPELGNLTNLSMLFLAENNLTGAIPAEIGNLADLVYLGLDHNNLTESIPAELGNLPLVANIDLSNNSLSGSIPADIGNLSSLNTLYLQGNELTGSIPSEIGDLTNLSYLYLNGNNLSGQIPAEIGDLSSLLTLNLSANDLTESIPAEFGNLSLLRFLDLSDNSLLGPIPTDIGNLSSLRYLYLQNTSLSGSIPSELGDLTLIETLYLADNGFSGVVPESLLNISSSADVSLSGQSGCLTAVSPELQAQLTAWDPLWNDGCAP